MKINTRGWGGEGGEGGRADRFMPHYSKPSLKL